MDYIGQGRSNYVKVKDLERFKELISECNLEIITKKDKMGFISDDGSIDSYDDEGNERYAKPLKMARY